MIMARNEWIRVFCFGIEIGVLGRDEDRALSFFHYNPEFLASERWLNLIPNTRIILRIPEMQLFKQFNNDTFRGLPPMFADSLPDMFGNMVFKTWLEQNNKRVEPLSVLEQLTYVADRGMGAFTYVPKQAIPAASNINLHEIVDVLKQVLNLKEQRTGNTFNHESLLNIFKIGTSAGGARPKILIAQHKQDGHILPGDLLVSDEYDQYLVKLHIEDEWRYNREVLEYAYYLTAVHCGISMMESKLIDEQHFATKRFDRKNGERIHVLTASGMAGWDYKDPEKSSYENLFDLALHLKVPHADMEELFKRMVFNVVFANRDDHLKNHSFCYNPELDAWRLAPAYDITYSLNPLLNYQHVARALSINQKRKDIGLTDIQSIAEKYTIRRYERIIDEVYAGIDFWRDCINSLNIPKAIVERIEQDIRRLS
jgi:serine/threonine-protein kinase HipA